MKVEKTLKCVRCNKDTYHSKYSGKHPLCYRCQVELEEIGIDVNQYVLVKAQ